MFSIGFSANYFYLSKLGFLAYDICFLVDGKEVEPSGDVKVVMDFKEAAVPEGVSEDAEVTVKHLKEDESAEDGVVVEDMTEAASVETTEKAAVQKVELVAESFSVFTVQWNGKSLGIRVVDSNGTPYPGMSEGENDYNLNNQSKIDVDEIADDIIYEKFPKELRGESLEELYKMQQCFVDYQGNYLIDTYTKRKK